MHVLFPLPRQSSPLGLPTLHGPFRAQPDTTASEEPPPPFGFPFPVPASTLCSCHPQGRLALPPAPQYPTPSPTLTFSPTTPWPHPGPGLQKPALMAALSSSPNPDLGHLSIRAPLASFPDQLADASGPGISNSTLFQICPKLGPLPSETLSWHTSALSPCGVWLAPACSEHCWAQRRTELTALVTGIVSKLPWAWMLLPSLVMFPW